ncbi:MAG TPA: penicillin-binding protein 1C [Deltaproteobacteria bacterium]|nr:penicillin-binding protein 1C [Deltaproteobacteria bacterium]
MGSGRWRWGALAAALILVAGFFALPVVTIEAPRSTVLTDRHGTLLGATTARDQQWRFPPSKTVPERFAAALITFEDRRFHQHPGVDPFAVLRALYLNVKAGAVRSGASTLTMQTVRVARGNPARTLPEKLIEMVLALRLEAARSKDEILAMYAANAPMGGNVVGLQAAAWRYYGRPADTLTWGEAATLAVLPNQPGLIHPGRNRAALRAKTNRLLDAMVERGLLSASDASLAKAESLPQAPLPIPQAAPHLLMKAPGQHTQTTLERATQLQATQIVERHAMRLAGNGIHNAAALVVEVQTGAVRAWVGNTGGLVDGGHHNHVDVVTAHRSTGSTLKPFLYGAMVQRGELAPTQLLPDTPTHIAGFSPENFDRSYDGAVRADTALARSRNVPAVWMLRRFGVDRFHGLLTRLGMTTLHRSPADYGLSLILGGSEGTLWELTGLYRNLGWSALHPDGGTRNALAWRAGSALVDESEVLDPAAAWLTLEALLEVNRPGVQSAWRSFDSGRPVAWKTGTSFGFRDGWAIGVTPELVIGVWVGNASGEGRPGLTGYQAAAPILFDLFAATARGSTWFEAPSALLDTVNVCAHSGLPAGPHCSHTTAAAIPRSASPTEPCPYCRTLHLSADRQHQVHAACAEPATMHHESWFVLPPAMAWFRTRSDPSYQTPPPLRSDCRQDGTPSFSVLYPGHGAEVYIPIEATGTRGRVVFEATHPERDGRLYWHIDDRYMGSTEVVHELPVAPTPGTHVLTVVDEQGARIARSFSVLDAGR